MKECQMHDTRAITRLHTHTGASAPAPTRENTGGARSKATPSESRAPARQTGLRSAGRVQQPGCTPPHPLQREDTLKMLPVRRAQLASPRAAWAVHRRRSGSGEQRRRRAVETAGGAGRRS